MKKIIKITSAAIFILLIISIYNSIYFDISRNEIISKHAKGSSEFLVLEDGSKIHFRDEGNEDYKIDEDKFKRLFLIELNNFFPNKQVSLPEFNGGKFAKCGSSIVKKMGDLDAVPK